MRNMPLASIKVCSLGLGVALVLKSSSGSPARRIPPTGLSFRAEASFNRLAAGNRRGTFVVPPGSCLRTANWYFCRNSWRSSRVESARKRSAIYSVTTIGVSEVGGAENRIDFGNGQSQRREDTWRTGAGAPSTITMPPGKFPISAKGWRVRGPPPLFAADGRASGRFFERMAERPASGKEHIRAAIPVIGGGPRLLRGDLRGDAGASRNPGR
jgi:hypothetical protein